MKLIKEKKKDASREVWRVTVKGCMGDADGDVSAVIYEGGQEDMAGRRALEALCLMQAFPSGRGGSSEYSYYDHAEAARDKLGLKRSENGEGAFEWVINDWESDPLCNGEVDCDIIGVDVEWIDAAGETYQVSLDMSMEEKKLMKTFEKADERSLSKAIEGAILTMSAWAEKEQLGQAARPAGRSAAKRKM